MSAKPSFDPNPPDPRIEMTLRPALLDQFVGQLQSGQQGLPLTSDGRSIS